MLNFKKISKSYKYGSYENIVLKNADISINESQINLIIGKSGVGKSTLLNIMGFLIKPDSGLVEIDDDSFDLGLDKIEKLRISKFSYVFQENNLLPEFTIYENLLLPAIINNMNLSKIKERINELLDYMDLNLLKNTYPNLISHGEKQRISLLRSMLGKQKIILADEPTGNLDEINTKIILDLIVKINKDLNYTFIIASHDLNFINIADIVYKIDNKKIKINE
tara:strand:- start:1084 stop:1752 length:669 start_codon:yes stop_codon:yes gene_type:complete